MSQAAWAEEIAHHLLKNPLPRRWAHTPGVAAQVRSPGPILGRDADLVEAAAWVHDIGYSPELIATGFHPLDGARHLRDAWRASPMLRRLVANHTGALIELTLIAVTIGIHRQEHAASIGHRPASLSAALACRIAGRRPGSTW